jgi:hypothetical protein
MRPVPSNQVEQALHLHTEHGNMAVHQQAPVQATLGDMAAVMAGFLQIPCLSEIRLIFLQQEPHPLVVGRQHRQRVAYLHDKLGLGVQVVDALDDAW